MICFCSAGTSSGGISTPRSPRATMTASDCSISSSRRSIAAGFSSFTSTAARLSISRRASATSSGRCTKDSATQSTFSSRPKVRSCRSLSVMAEMGSTTPGTLTPLRSLSLPPVTTVVSAKSGPQRSTRSLSLPSSSSRSVPGASAWKISGWARQTRWRSPSVGAISRRKGWPDFKSTDPPANLPTRSFGPCRSIMMAIGRPVSVSIWRMDSHPRPVILRGAMAEIEAEHVDAGIEQGPDGLRRGARRSQGGDDLGFSIANHADGNLAADSAPLKRPSHDDVNRCGLPRQ